MSDLFIKIFNLSVTAGWLTLAVLICRPLMKKAPKWINCLLWGIVGLRLVFPFSLESIFSLIPSAEPIPQDIMISPTPEINSGIGAVNSVINPMISTNLTPGIGTSVNPMQLVVAVASVVWVIGIALILGYGIVSYISLRFKVRAAIKGEKNVYFCDEVDSPFILGVIRPRIYVPSGMSGEALGHVLAHERAHLRRGDHFWKPVGFALLAFYWFNPLLWVAYALLCRDIESACDEKVIKTMSAEAKKSYSEALLSCSLHRKRIMACPLAFGEVGVKQRIKSVLSYKKPAFWIIVVALVATLVLSVCFLTNPQSNLRELLEPGSQWRYDGDITISVTVDGTVSMEGLLWGDNLFDEIVIRYRNDGRKVRAYVLKAEIEDIEYESNGDLVSSTEYNEWRDRVEAEHLLFSGILSARGDDVVLKIDQDNIGIGRKRLVLKRTNPSSASYPISVQDANGNYIKIIDSGSETKGVDASLVWAKREGDEVVFWLKWKNKSLPERSIGRSFKIFRYGGANELLPLEGVGAWPADALKVSRSVTYMSYDITEHYDISAPGKYRFESDGAWVEFEVRRVEDKDAEIDKAMLFDISGGGKYDQEYIYVSDFGCESVNIGIEPKQIKRDGDGIVFILEWSNERDNNYNLGKPFKIFRYTDNGEPEELSYICAGSDPNNPVYPVWEAVGYVVWKKSKSCVDYNITDYYDISLPGKYRFESDGAWVEFEVIREDKEETSSQNEVNNATVVFDPSYSAYDPSRKYDVYVWQMAQNSFSFALLDSKPRDWLDDELFNIKGVPAALMRQILLDKNLGPDDVNIVRWQNPVSSYIGDFWVRWAYMNDNTPQENFYYAIVYDMLFGASPHRDYPTATETEWFDIDGDGVKEDNLIVLGLVDGKFMFRYIISEDNKTASYYDTFYTAPMSLKFFTSDGKLRLRGVTEDGGVHIYDIALEGGHIKLTEIENTPIADASNKTLDLSKADLSLVDRIVITNGQTGEVAYLNTMFDRNSFNNVMAAIKTVKASDPVSNRGYSGFSYHVELYYDYQTFFSFSLYNDEVDGARIICGYYETVGSFNYPARYKLTNPSYEKLDEVLGKHFK